MSSLLRNARILAITPELTGQLQNDREDLRLLEFNENYVRLGIHLSKSISSSTS